MEEWRRGREEHLAKKERATWRTELEFARERPLMFLGDFPRAHLWEPVHHSLTCLWEEQPFEAARYTEYRFTPSQYVLHHVAGPLCPRFAKLGRWKQCDVLIRELDRVWDRYALQLDRETALMTASHDFGRLVASLVLGNYGVVALGLPSGVWWQTYRHGWPQGLPSRLPQVEGGGLVVAAALGASYFPGLPYREEAVRKEIPEVAQPHVRLSFQAEDNLVPESLLQPEEAERWLSELFTSPS